MPNLTITMIRALANISYGARILDVERPNGCHACSTLGVYGSPQLSPNDCATLINGGYAEEHDCVTAITEVQGGIVNVGIVGDANEGLAEVVIPITEPIEVVTSAAAPTVAVTEPVVEPPAEPIVEPKPTEISGAEAIAPGRPAAVKPTAKRNTAR